MQHYGAPTRLLDWTYSPYVALYFALDDLNTKEDCAVWALDKSWLVDASARAILEKWPSAGPQPQRFYRGHPILRENNPEVVIFLEPARLSERATAQQGTFLCNLSLRAEFDGTLSEMILAQIPDRSPIWKVTVKNSRQTEFLKHLHRMNIDAATLFPGLEGFARSLRWQARQMAEAELLNWLASRAIRNSEEPGSS
jgi:hypothetical protein